MPAARKGAVQIRFEILEYMYYNPEPQPRTHIWRRATSLSYDDFLKHFYYLIEKELLQEDADDGCSITRRGRDVYDELRRVLPSIL